MLPARFAGRQRPVATPRRSPLTWHSKHRCANSCVDDLERAMAEDSLGRRDARSRKKPAPRASAGEDCENDDERRQFPSR